MNRRRRIQSFGLRGKIYTPQLLRPAPPWTPKDISGLVMWLSADNAPGCTVGSKVSSWPDLSGNGNHAVQGTSINQPTLTAGVIGIRPAVVYNNGSASMRLSTGGNISLNDMTMMVACKLNSSEEGNRILDHGGGFGLQGISDSGSNLRAFKSLDYAVPAGSSIFTLTKSGTDGVAFLNGESKSTASACANVALSAAVTVGASYATTGLAVNGALAQVLIWSKALSTAERNLAEGWLSSLYGITVA